MNHPYTNDLINESSPYLLQHAHNPVHWQAWSEAVWRQARQEDKPVIVSIGYSSCHWCHVMEHQSFEDTTVAALMNDHFICIKVDREERPDVDQIYMDACQLITGRGGWPLNAITLPDGRPLYAGTYFPKENWIQVLHYFIDYWKNKRDEALERAGQLTRGIKAMDQIAAPQPDTLFTEADRTAFFAGISSSWDYEKGGRNGAPKFPMPVTLQYLLQHYAYTHRQTALQAVTVTLDNMMNGGIYDQVGGGFARYSVDSLWRIPHFEKMLYDNAQLVSVYADAYRVTRNERYREVITESLDFVEREMSDEAGGFYSALDADSEGEEGKYYVWSYRSLQLLLGNDFDAFCRVFEVSPEGNFEGDNHLIRHPDAEVDSATLQAWKAKLLQARSQRPRPGLDDKVLTSWNALMLKAYTDAYRALGDDRWLQRAVRTARFLSEKMIQPDYSIKRNYRKGRVSIRGFLDDYSYTCEALLSLYEVTFDKHWLHTADKLAAYAIQHFYNPSTHLFFYTDVDDAPLIARKTETSDNVLPSSNSCMAKVLYRLGVYFDRNEDVNMARQALLQLKTNALQYPGFYANWAMLADWMINAPMEVAIVGNDAEALRKETANYFLPQVILAGSNTPSSLPLLVDRYRTDGTYIYVCQHKICQLPVISVKAALEQIGSVQQ